MPLRLTARQRGTARLMTGVDDDSAAADASADGSLDPASAAGGTRPHNGTAAGPGGQGAEPKYPISTMQHS